MSAIRRLESETPDPGRGCGRLRRAGAGRRRLRGRPPSPPPGLVVWALVLVGLATGVAAALRAARAPPSSPASALAGLAALMALSLAWASDDGNGFEDVVRTLAYLGLFVLVVLASRRGEARPWLAGLAIGLALVGAIALLGRFEPSWFGNPDADLAEDLPAVLGRLTYPIGYWNGLAAAMAAAIVLLGWFAASSPSRRIVRSAAVAAMPAVLLALWMTDSRGGIVAAALASRSSLAAGPHAVAPGRQPALGVARRGGPDRASPRPATRCSTSRRRTPRRTRATRCWRSPLLLVAATLAAPLRARRAASSGSRSRDAAGRVVLAVAGVAVLVAVVAADPVAAVGRLQGGADRRGAGERRRRPAARRRQRPLPVLGDGGRRLRRARRSAASERAATRRTGSSTGTSRSPRPARTRCSSRRWPSSGSSAWRCCSASSPSSRSPRSGGVRAAGADRRGGPGAGAAGGRLRRRRGRLDLGSARGLRGDGRRRGAAHRAGDAARPRGRAAAGRRGRCAAAAASPAAWSSCWSPGSRSAAPPCCSCRRTRSTRAATRRPTATSRRRSTRPTTRSTSSRGRPSRGPQLALVYEQAGDYGEAARGDRRGDRALARRLPPAPARRADGRRGRGSRGRGRAALVRRPPAQPARPRRSSIRPLMID